MRTAGMQHARRPGAAVSILIATTRATSRRWWSTCRGWGLHITEFDLTLGNLLHLVRTEIDALH